MLCRKATLFDFYDKDTLNKKDPLEIQHNQRTEKKKNLYSIYKEAESPISFFCVFFVSKGKLLDFYFTITLMSLIVKLTESY